MNESSVASDLHYDREVLTTALIYHARTDTSGCHCGWAVLGASYADHVADVYEQAVAAQKNPSSPFRADREKWAYGSGKDTLNG